MGAPVYTTHTPGPWAIEVERNASGRKFYFISRFTSARSVEYIEDASGDAKCFRLERDAYLACLKANNDDIAKAEAE